MTARTFFRWSLARRLKLQVTVAAASCLVSPFAVGAQQLFAGYYGSKELADLSLEELANVRVTSVTGRPAPAHEAAASLFVITGEDIRRSTAACRRPSGWRPTYRLPVLVRINGRSARAASTTRSATSCWFLWMAARSTRRFSRACSGTART